MEGEMLATKRPCVHSVQHSGFIFSRHLPKPPKDSVVHFAHLRFSSRPGKLSRVQWHLIIADRLIVVLVMRRQTESCFLIEFWHASLYKEAQSEWTCMGRRFQSATELCDWGLHFTALSSITNYWITEVRRYFDADLVFTMPTLRARATIS